MNCILKEIVNLGRDGICPYSGRKCDGEMNLTWQREYATIPEEKVCISATKEPVLVQVRAADLDKIRNGAGVLLINTEKNGLVFVKAEAAEG